MTPRKGFYCAGALILGLGIAWLALTALVLALAGVVGVGSVP